MKCDAFLMRIRGDVVINKVVVEAPCKINLTLDIIDRRQSGYHDMEMVMQSLDYFDTITIRETGTNIIEVTDQSPQLLQGKESISYRVAQEFFDFTGEQNPGIEIDIKNKIPACAGLAGGSADGAAVLVGLNEMFGSQLSQKQLCSIGLKVGADIPFCIVGGTALTEGIGEKITALSPLKGGYFVVMKPEWGVSTPEAFALYDQSLVERRPDNKQMLQAIQCQDLELIGKTFCNVFQDVLKSEEIDSICNKMKSLGALGASMTGSGSAVFGIFEDECSAQKCYEQLILDYEDGFIARPYCKGASTKRKLEKISKHQF